MESLRALPEAVEVEFGNTITVRDAAIESLTTGRVHGQSSVLGPPDLVWLQKQQQPSSLLGPWSRTGQPVGFYHTVVGRDIGSAAAVAGYFGTLAARIEPCTGLTLWPGAGGEWKLQRGIYACYGADARMDVDVHEWSCCRAVRWG
jgi:ChAPs (Chs5p-Arf1p-binding proteins)